MLIIIYLASWRVGLGGNSSDIIYNPYLENQEAKKHKKTKKGSNGHIKYLNNYAINITFKRAPWSLTQNLFISKEFSAHILEGSGYTRTRALTCSSL